ncbi:MAG: anaerobic glycerol-3-phosphate dehydrogenase subunit GlpB [Anaerolineales bacterium]
MTDVLIVGAGLSGLFASIVAVKHGARVTLVASGNGGLSLSHGCIDVWSGSPPSRVLSRLRKSHPYRLAGKRALNDAVDMLDEISRNADYPLLGSLSKATLLPTAFGAIHTTAYAPASLAQTSIQKGKPISIGTIPGLRDFFPDLLAKNIEMNGYTVERTIQLPLPGAAPRRDLYATDLAQRFENPSDWVSIARLWKPRLAGVDRLGIPAVLGIHDSHRIFTAFQDFLDIGIFEIPTPPPSLPGLRLEKILSAAATKMGVDIILGSSATGRIERSKKVRRVSGVVLHTTGGEHNLDARGVILATGGFLNGGLAARRDGNIVETVFNLPVQHSEDRQAWLASSPFEEQPYEKFGLLVNSRMQPLDLHGDPVFENLYAAVVIISGADRQCEGSRQGIDLATAYRAAEAALE